MNVKRRVVKVGGSLFTSERLWSRLDDWLRQTDEYETILVVGGGAEVDALREHDRDGRLDQVAVHWRCIELMRDNAHRAREQLPGLVWLRTLGELPPTAEPGRRWLLDPLTFLQVDDVQRSSQPLPASWDVTSDSIAARLAELSGADELVLLKSTLPSAQTRAECVSTGFVDRFFAQAAARLRCVRIVDFRSTTFASRILPPSEA
ncbi:MAG: hypothetical protein JNM18_10905 [Planctomycetaceae bacterium]|nr:hypothetical protein [Planctomycetaceae bacterium]